MRRTIGFGYWSPLLLASLSLFSCQLAAQASRVAIQAPSPGIKAQYAWGYAGADGEGKGTLSVWVEPSTGKVVLELHGAGERLVFLQGDRAAGYHLQIPRRELDQTSSSFSGLDLPFLPAIGTAEGLNALITKGIGPGVSVSKTDKDGPVKLRYRGKDERGKDVRVWLTRERWEIQKP